MKSNFTITAFADEINPDLQTQIRVLKENGINHIELRGVNGKNVSEFSHDEAKRYHKELEDAGITVSSIGSPIGNIGIEDSFEEHLTLFEHVVSLAQLFQAPFIRMFSFYIPEGKDPSNYRESVISRFKEFVKIIKGYPEITLLHENEKEIFGDTPERCLDLIESINDSQVKLAFDPANFVQCDVEVFPHAYDMLKDHIAYVHIKDARFSDHKVTPAGLGDGKVELVLKQLIEQDFRGFASIEPHLSIFDGFLSLEKKGESITDIKESETDGEKLFNVASNALKEILVNHLGQEWR